jgi:hypothetical protein
VLPIGLEGSGGYSMFDDFRGSYSWILEPHKYKDNESLISALPQVIAPADRIGGEFQKSTVATKEKRE